MTKLKELPPPLARQIVFRFVGAGLSLFACICSFLLYGEPYLSISLLAIALVVGISGAWFYYTGCHWAICCCRGAMPEG